MLTIQLLQQADSYNTMLYSYPSPSSPPPPILQGTVVRADGISPSSHHDEDLILSFQLGAIIRISALHGTIRRRCIRFRSLVSFSAWVRYHASLIHLNSH